MLCCLLTALMAGNLVVAGRTGLSLMRRPGPLAAIGLLIAGAVSIAIAPAVAEHGQHYVARAMAHHRSVLEEILAQPLCSGETRSGETRSGETRSGETRSGEARSVEARSVEVSK